MICSHRLIAAAAVALGTLALPSPVVADETGPFYDGIYLSPMATGVFPTGHHAPLKNGYGATLPVGYRNGWYAVEIAPIYADLKHAQTLGASVNGLLFPFKGNFYATIGLGALDYSDFETPASDEEFNVVHVDGGLGYILPISTGRYDWGLRAEVRYRYGDREEKFNDTDTDIDAPTRFKQVIANVGLYLPLGVRPEPPPEAAPVAVVAPAAICADTLDNDGDGLIDFPGDPGCSAADDTDETDPPPPPPPPCKTPAPGERVSLQGCGTGDTIVLRGVNFEFDRSNLTVDAKTILDNVVEELAAYPAIHVEVGGHTDAKGSDEYNQSLSERRAAAVVAYLASKGVAADRMTSAGYGESKPVADNESDEGRELNRRVELRITQ